MERYHPLLELAPRDVVARAIAREGMGRNGRGEVRVVHLDMRHIKGLDLHKRFPGISAFLAQHGLDLGRDLIPVRPAAHYLMGGIRTDLHGRTNLLASMPRARWRVQASTARIAWHRIPCLKGWSSARVRHSPCWLTHCRR